MKQMKYYVRLDNQKLQFLMKEKEKLRKKLKSGSLNNKGKKNIQKNKNNSRKIMNKNFNTEIRNNIIINNSINNVLNNITINTNQSSEKYSNNITGNNSKHKLRDKLFHPFSNKKDIRMSFISLIQKKNMSRNVSLNHTINNSSNHSYNFMSLNSKKFKPKSFYNKINKNETMKLEKINSINKKFNLVVNKTLMNSSNNYSINENMKKQMIIPFYSNKIDNSMRNTFFGIGNNKLLKKEIENKIRNVFDHKGKIKKSINIINMNLNKKKLIKQNISQNKSDKNNNNIFKKNNFLKTENNENLNNNMNDIKKFKQNFIIKRFKLNINNNYINKNESKLRIKKKKNNNNLISDKNNQKLNDKDKISINDKEINKSKTKKIKKDKIINSNSSLDNTLQFSKYSSKAGRESEGELSLDEVKDIIIYFKLNKESKKDYLFKKEDYIEFLQKRKKKYFKFFVQ